MSGKLHVMSFTKKKKNQLLLSDVFQVVSPNSTVNATFQNYSTPSPE